jgi:type I restriction enzyme R subunit
MDIPSGDVLIQELDTRIDWSIREQARAPFRCMIKRVLKRHGYPPNMQEGAVNMVIEQAEGLVS